MDALTALTAPPNLLGPLDAPRDESSPAALPQARDDGESPALDWRLRSEAFPEDLDPDPAATDRRPRLARRHRLALMWGLGLPLCVAVIGLGSWLGLA